MMAQQVIGLGTMDPLLPVPTVPAPQAALITLDFSFPGAPPDISDFTISNQSVSDGVGDPADAALSIGSLTFP